MNKIALIFLLMLVTCFSFAEIYKWTDSQGVTHFSDTPQRGAKKIELPNVQTYSTPNQQNNANSNQVAKPDNTGLSASSQLPPVIQPQQPAANGDEDKPTAYTSIRIVQPQDQETIRNPQGYIALVVMLEPQLSKKNMLQVLLDGSPYGDPQSGTFLQITGVYRGSHELSVQILDEKGNPLLTSDSITIYMQPPRVNMGKPRN